MNPLIPQTCFVAAIYGFIAYEMQPVCVPTVAAPAQITAISAPIQQPSSREITAVVTAYCPCFKCCGKFSKEGRTSQGRDARKVRGVAVDPKLISYGSIVTIPGQGSFVADDTGGAMRQSGRKGIVHIDLRFFDHKTALQFGRQLLQVTVK